MRDRFTTIDVVVAIAVGVVLAIVAIEVAGYLAAIAYPGWVRPFAYSNKLTLLNLWEFVVEGIPLAVLAAAFGIALARMTRNASWALPLIALGIFALYLEVLLPVRDGMPAFPSYDMPIVLLPGFLARWALFSVALLLAFRHAVRRP